MKKCDILAAEPFRWSEETKGLAIQILKTLRPAFSCGPEQAKGTRFYSDVTGIWALTSTFTEEEFRSAGFTAAHSALDYLSASDHWYTYEKDWGDDA